MQTPPETTLSARLAGNIRGLSSLFLLLCLAGCGNGNGNGNMATTPAPPASPTNAPQTYFAPGVAGTTNGPIIFNGAKIFSVDDFADTFTESNFALQLPQQQGSQVINSGVITPLQRGLLAFGISTNYINAAPVSYSPPKAGSFAVELAGQAGGLVQLVGQPVDLLVAAVDCPNLTTAQTYQYLTIPGGLIDSATAGPQADFWDPTTDTAYGSVDISSNGVNVSFNNIQQHTLPSIGGSGVPAQQPTSPVTGTCGPTIYGNTITLGQLTVTNPGAPGSNSTPTQGSVGIGPTGLLVEDNGSGGGILPGTSPVLPYDNTLGAGTGAVGLPKPSSPVTTSAVIGAQYLGFVYGAGVFSGNAGAPPNGWSSHLASFGFSSVPSNCASVAASTSTLIYGGDFPQSNGQDNPSAGSNGFGNCDLAIDLGTQDPSNNGSYPQATVWMGASYAANTTGKTYSFPAVAIAGQLNGKNAIFVLGVDSTQPWAIYLLQSN